MGSAFNNSGIDDPVLITVSDIPDTRDFVGFPLIGYMTLRTQFTDISSGTYDHWLWDFGDGAQSVERNPAHFYANPGFYTVTLTITGDSGTFVVRKENYIRVTGKYTYDIAPDPDKEAYLSGIGMVFLRNVGVELRRVKA